MSKALFLSFILWSIANLSVGQNTRIEIKLNRIPNSMEVLSLQQKGFLLLYSGGDKRGSGRNSWNITKFNHLFEEEWNKLIEIPSRFTVNNYVNDSIGNRYIWLSQSTIQLRIDILDLKDGSLSTQTYSSKNHAKNIVSSIINNDKLYILLKSGPDEELSSCYSTCCFPISYPMQLGGVSIFKYGSVYMQIDLKTQLKYERNDADRGISIPDKIQVSNSADNTVAFSSFKRKSHSSSKSMIITKMLAKNLSTQDSLIIESPADCYLQNVQIAPSENGYVAVGTFNRDAPDPDDILSVVDAQGIYTTMIDALKHANQVKLVRFVELGSFQAHLEDFDPAVYNKMSENKKKKLKNKYRNYSTLIHLNKIVERQNDFILIAEAFYPVYSNYRDANGSMIRYFEGYNYNFCYILCFDKNGNLKWDKTFILDFNRLYMNIFQKVKVLQSDNNVQLSYGSGSSIDLVSIEGDSISQPKNITLPRLFEKDAKVNEFISDVTPWYGTKYLLWGVQRIKKSDIKDREGNNIIYLDEMELK